MSGDFVGIHTGSFSTPAAGNPTVVMVEAAYRHHGIDARYLNCEVPSAALGDGLRSALVDGAWDWPALGLLVLWAALAGLVARRLLRWSD